jgi:toxin-antitoxin system PIN domain toxin
LRKEAIFHAGWKFHQPRLLVFEPFFRTLQMVALLDLNVLIALFDPAHVYHEAAHAWFAVNRRRPWATCPLTENAFVRRLSNPSYPGQCTTAADALARLRDLCSQREHVFWPDSVSIREPGRLRWNHVQGHRHITDAYLLAMAVVNKGRLATFDSSISLRAIEGAKEQNLEVIGV